ncbi:MAG TPA: peptidoglycan DD-metalloendopeptidase family protein [Thermosynechococcaceae cyanobacterium]
MERAIPQKVKPLPSCETETDMLTSQSKPVESNRLVRTSAAMLGLAISVGTHGLLVPGSNDGAIAAEPIPEKSVSEKSLPEKSVSEKSVTAEVTPVTIATASQSPAFSAPAKSDFVEHTVQEGQTLQQLARFYGVDVSAVANANSLSMSAVLRVGQVLTIPASNLVARAIQSDTASSATPEYYGLVSGSRSSAPAPEFVAPTVPDATLKAEQDASLSRLQQRSEDLRQRLAQAKVEKQEAPVKQEAPITIAAQPKASIQPKVTVASEASPVVVPESIATAKIDPVPAALEQPQKEAKEAVVTLTDSASYRVASGDTLSAIARSYGISEVQLAAANKISNPNLIRANQVLTIPQRQASQQSAGTSALFSDASKTPLVVAASGVPVIGVATSENATRSDAAQLIEARLQQVSSPETRIAATTLPGTGVRTERSGDVIVPTTSHSYVENLKIEVLKLREKYSAAGVQPGVKGETVSLNQARTSEAAPELINPEFNPKAYSASEQAQGGQSRVQKTPRSLPAQPQRVATASLGSQDYAPLTSSMLGQMVSPSLPPLGAAEAYLPGKSGKFSGYIWPAQGMLSSGYGWRWGRMHKGIDIAGPVGTPIVAAAPGTVTYADWNSGGYGNLVEITHPDGSVTLYAHNNRILVRQGQEVAQGEQIAEMGSTGYSTGPHSHFEVHLPGQGAVNPVAYLTNQG